MSKIALKIPRGIPFDGELDGGSAESIRLAIAYLAAEARKEGFVTAAHLLEAAALDMFEQGEPDDVGAAVLPSLRASRLS